MAPRAAARPGWRWTQAKAGSSAYADDGEVKVLGEQTRRGRIATRLHARTEVRLLISRRSSVCLSRAVREGPKMVKQIVKVKLSPFSSLKH